jgi:hypothetical protein
MGRHRKEITVTRAKQRAGIVLGIMLSVSLALGGSALGQEAETTVLQLTPSRNSGVSGTAILKDVAGGVEVKLNMRGLPEAGVKHINHIHGGGTCADDRAGRTAPVTIPLNPVVATEDGTGSATTTIEDVTVAQLFEPDKERFILLHAKTEEGQGVPPGIACADLVEAAGSGAVSTELPESGGTHLIVLFSAVVILVLGTLSGSFAWRRGVLPRRRVD